MASSRLPILALLLLALQVTSSEHRSSTAFLFTYFMGNGEDGLHLAASDDGLRWTALGAGRSYLAPTVGTKLMRDPCLVQGPDGQFQLVWTTGWWDQGIGVAHSPDLITWSAQQFVPVMAHESTAPNAWAPEILHDRTTGRFLMYWASTIPGRFPETESGGAAGPAFTRDWVEGPTALKVGDAWLVYFDEYTRKRYGAVRTRDFITWEDVSDSVRFPKGARHGTTIVVPRAIVEALRRVSLR